MKISERVTNIAESKSIGIGSLVGKLKSEGRDVISFHVGEPDFNTPGLIINATIEALKNNQTKYSHVAGLPFLREQLATYLMRQEGFSEICENNITVANGSKHILYNIFQTICDVGDEIIVLAPYWVSFPESVKLAGGKPVIVETKDNQLDVSLVQAAITKKTKAVIINSPNNPTGAVYSEQALKDLVEIVIKNDLILISDEAYESIVYDGLKHNSPATFSKEAFARTLTVKSFSKVYCMTGFRVGYLVADEVIVNSINKLHGHLSGNVCTFAQFGALAALDTDKNIFAQMLKIFEKRRDLAFKLCSELFPCVKPQGAFYVFPNIEKYLGDKFPTSVELAEYILKETNVAVVPGSAYGAPNFMRISFAVDEKDIIEGFRRISSVL